MRICRNGEIIELTPEEELEILNTQRNDTVRFTDAQREEERREQLIESIVDKISSNASLSGEEIQILRQKLL